MSDVVWVYDQWKDNKDIYRDTWVTEEVDGMYEDNLYIELRDGKYRVMNISYDTGDQVLSVLDTLEAAKVTYMMLAPHYPWM